MSHSALQYVVDAVAKLEPNQRVSMTKELIDDIGLFEYGGFTWNGADQVLEGIKGAAFEYSYRFDQETEMYWFYRWPALPMDGDKRTYVSPDKRSGYAFDGRFYCKQVGV